MSENDELEKKLSDLMSKFKMPELDFKTQEDRDKANEIIINFNKFVKKRDFQGAKKYLLHVRNNERSSTIK